VPASRAVGYALCARCEWSPVSRFRAASPVSRVRPVSPVSRVRPVSQGDPVNPVDRPPHHTAPTVSGSSIASGVTGSRTVTVMPSPGADVAETVPPWAATMAATMDSPSPLPP